MRDLFCATAWEFAEAGLCLTTLCGSCLARALGDFLVTFGVMAWVFGAKALGVSGEEYRNATDVFSYTILVKGDKSSIELVVEGSFGEATFGEALNWLTGIR